MCACQSMLPSIHGAQHATSELQCGSARPQAHTEAHVAGAGVQQRATFGKRQNVLAQNHAASHAKTSYNANATSAQGMLEAGGHGVRTSDVAS